MAISLNEPPPSIFEYFAIFTLDNSRMENHSKTKLRQPTGQKIPTFPKELSHFLQT